MMMKTLLGIFLSLAGLVNVQAAMFQVPVAGGNSLTLTGNVGLSASFPLRIENLTNVNITVPSTNRLMVMSGVDKQMTNAFKRFYYDTNSAASLSNLIAGASRGDVIELGAGNFYIGTQSIRPPFGVTLKGQGIGTTVIYGDVGGTPVTNCIVQLMSDCVYEDMTIVANQKGPYYQWPMGNSSIWGNTPCTNVTIRRVELDGDTDCISITQADWTSGTVEDCYFHSSGDVFNLTSDQVPIGVPGETTPGNSWIFKRTRLYSDASTIQSTSWGANPTANGFSLNNGSVEFYGCELIATNHKATAFGFQGTDTNRAIFVNTLLSASGTNGWGYEFLDNTGASILDGQLIQAEFYNTPLKPSDINSDKVLTFKDFTAGNLYSKDDIQTYDQFIGNRLFVTNLASSGSVSTGDLDSTGQANFENLFINALIGSFIFSDGNEALGMILSDVDGAGTVGWTSLSGGTPWTQDQNAGGFSLTNALSIVLNSTARGSVQLNGTNGTPVVITAASSNSVPVTNVVGLIHKASAAVIVVDCNNANKFQITNQLGQGTSIIVTNLAQGQEISISGSADGTSRTVTVIPQLGFLVRDFDTFGVAAATSKAITATNGNTFEINIAAKWGFGTNFADVVTRQALY